MAYEPSQNLRQRLKSQDPTTVANGTLDTPPQTTTTTPPLPSITTIILTIYLPILTSIFLGCCSNVYNLESLISISPSSGPLLTFAQFILVSLFSSSSCLYFSQSPPFFYLKPREIPIRKWVVYTVLFLTINMLNNTAFRYKISIPLHIILRSAGPVMSMAVGYVYKKAHYPRLQIVAVALLFSGVVLAALSDSYSKRPSTETLTADSTLSKTSMLYEQAPGFLLLFFALALSSILGLYTDSLYALHGRSAQITAESLFYSHTLSLPFFGFQLSNLTSSFQILITASPPLSTSFAAQTSSFGLDFGPRHPLHTILSAIPTALFMLFLNALTQALCISGVNRLAATSSSLTVSIVLTIRKLVSLLLSIWLFGNRLPVGVMLGAGLVFAGGGMYALPTKRTAAVVGWEGKRIKKEL